MNKDNIWQEFYTKGVRQIKIHWRAGGDDGGIEGIDIFPKTLAVTKEIEEELIEVVWDYLENEMEVATTGNFNNDGEMIIKIFKDAPYHVAKAWNDYEDYESGTYNEEKEEYDNVETEHQEYDAIELAEFKTNTQNRW